MSDAPKRPEGRREVTVTNFNMPIGSMVVFMVKWAKHPFPRCAFDQFFLLSKQEYVPLPLIFLLLLHPNVYVTLHLIVHSISIQVHPKYPESNLRLSLDHLADGVKESV